MNDGKRLLGEFQNHANKYNEEPTALVSVSNRIIDTLNRAFHMHLVDGEDLSDIWVAFIEVPAAASAMVHRARPLAEAIRLDNSSAFEHEFIFEWTIPNERIMHQVHLQTLIDRGLRYSDFLGPELQYISTYEMRDVLFLDCVPTKIICDDVVSIRDMQGRRARVRFDFFSELEEGINTALVDW
ncbi:unnamed protein product [Clonostachys rosea f. rosea IK726]|uniref:Uncharacterized protein n=1 Tax=Clonostachys rosea f. rosea IK726 TaxID=1349383 RepID=A0ACA9U743_BIOOC|nr:unnamed protein product [Clonostachys rosea f. rosea IK726]